MFFRSGRPKRLFNVIHIACVAAVFPEPGFPCEEPAVFQVLQRPLDTAAGKAKFPAYRADGRKAFTFLIRTIPQIHVYRYRPVGQVGGVDGAKVSHLSSPLLFDGEAATMPASVVDTGHGW